MSILTQGQLKALSNGTFFDNDQGEIEPAEHRAFNEALIDSVVLKPTDVGYVVYPGDGKRYPVKKINGIWYTVKNHESTVYADGSPISAWSDGSTAQYNDNEGYGKLYSGYVAEQANLCPAGWKVPAKDDFDALLNFFGSTDTERKNGLINVWKGVLGGLCNSDGIPSSLGSNAYYWSSTYGSSSSAYHMYFGNGYANPGIVNSYKNYGFSLRFIITDESLIQYYDQGSAEFVEEDLKPVTYYSGTSLFSPTIDIDFDTPRKLDVFQFKNSGYNNTPIWFTLNSIGRYSDFGATKTIVIQLDGGYDLRSYSNGGGAKLFGDAFYYKENGVGKSFKQKDGVHLMVNGANNAGAIYKKLVTLDTNDSDRNYIGLRGYGGIFFMIKFQFYGQYARFCTVNVFDYFWDCRSIPS
jgi:uncharacterized protein (TIGR02145 family)